MRLALALLVVVAGGPGAHAEAPFVPQAAREAFAEGAEAYRRGEFSKAVTAWRRALDLAPGNLTALVNLGLAEMAAGNSHEAEKVLKEALRRRLETAPAWLTLGTLYLEQGRLDEALGALAQATAYDPRHARARNLLGAVMARKGWLDAAQSELRRAAELDPSLSDAHYNLASLYLERKPPLVELARRHYFRALDLGAERDPSLERELERLSQKPQP